MSYYYEELNSMTYDALSKIGSVLKQHPEMNVDFMTSGQIDSKLWLIQEWECLDWSKLPANMLTTVSIQDDPTVFIMAGWYGMLPFMLFRSIAIEYEFPKIRSFDMDGACQPIADLLNSDHIGGWQFKATTTDINNLQWDSNGFCTYYTQKPDGTLQKLYDKPDVIINTSCEHIENFPFWMDTLPKNTLLILQSNDLVIDEHINRVSSIEEFKEQTNLKCVLFEGELKHEEAGYTRYMLIGIK